MIHLGDITKIKGSEVPMVDIVTGGSPCQDLSVAGKRAGLDGERSGLFMEQIRIIKEMREHDKRNRGADVDIRLLRPRFMVWENVPGAFSSNKGEDFRAVLEETAKIVCEDAVIPRPPKGKWSPSGCIMGDGWSIAWRVHDAQFWGVPQRRKRIALVADFGGSSAPKILFECKSVSGDSEQSEQEREEAAGTVGTGINPSSYTLKIRGGVEVDSHGKRAGKGALIQTELSGTLGVSQDQTLITKCLNSWDVQSKHIQPQDGVAESLYSGECRGGGGESYVMQEQEYQQNVCGINGEVAGTLDSSYYKGCGERQGIECEVVIQSESKVYGICSYESNSMKSGNPNSGIYEAETARTLDNNGGNPACNQGGMIVLENEAVSIGNGQMCNITMKPIANALDTMHDQQAVLVQGVDAHNLSTKEETAQTILSGRNDSHNVPCVTYGLDRASFNQGKNAQFDFSVEEELAQPIVARGPGGTEQPVGPLCARDYKGVGTQYVNEGKVIVQDI